MKKNNLINVTFLLKICDTSVIAAFILGAFLLITGHRGLALKTFTLDFYLMWVILFFYIVNLFKKR